MQNRVNAKNAILQCVSTSSATAFSSTTLMPFDNTIPQNTEGGEIITLSITPKFSTSKLLIEYYAQGNCTLAISNYWTVGLFQDSTANALAAISVRLMQSNVIRHVMTSATTSSTTFKIRSGPGLAIALSAAYTNADGLGARWMGGVSKVWLTITEYLA